MKSPLAVSPRFPALRSSVSPRFPALRSSEQGESAPKARLRSVVDGNQINISEPCASAMGGRSVEDHPGVGHPGL